MDRARIEPNTQPIPCQFSHFCGGYTSSWVLKRGPALARWVFLCDRCAHDLAETMPDGLKPVVEAPEPVSEASVSADDGVLRCECGMEFTGPTAKAVKARHQRACEVHKAAKERSESEG